MSKLRVDQLSPTDDSVVINVSDIAQKSVLSSLEGASTVNASDGRTVEEWLVASDSAAYRAKNMAKLAQVDFMLRQRSNIGVCFLGDSMTAGMDTTSSDVIPPQDGDHATRASMNYPYRFAEYLEEKSGCTVSPFVMRAISGQTAKNAWEKTDWNVNPDCDVVIINYGINDSGRLGTGIDDYMLYMEKLIRRYIDWGCAVVIGMPYAGLRGAYTPTWLNWGRRSRMMSTIYGCPWFNSFEINLMRPAGAVQSDQHHMNSMGYAIFGEKMASMFMAGGLLDTCQKLTNEITVWPGMINDTVGMCDAFNNVNRGLSDTGYIRPHIVGTFPAGQDAMMSFSFYLDAEAAHIYAKLNGSLKTNYTNGTEWNNGAKNYYAHALDQTVSYGQEINRQSKSPEGYSGVAGSRRFIGRVIGRGWHTISFSKAAADGAAYLNSLTVQPIPIGMSVEQMWSGEEERRYKVVSAKKTPSPAGMNGVLPAAITLTTFMLRAPQSILGTGDVWRALARPYNYNSGHAKLIITNSLGAYIECLVLKTVADSPMYTVSILNSTLESSARPTITCQLATRKRNTIVAAGSQGTSQPWVAIDDYNGGTQLQGQAAGDADWTGGVFMVFNLTWPGTAPSSYWNIELEGSDWFGNSESAFGAY